MSNFFHTLRNLFLSYIKILKKGNTDNIDVAIFITCS